MRAQPTGPTTAQEKKWKGEADARTLAEAGAIAADAARLKNAQKEAKEMADEAVARAEAMVQVANAGKPVKGSTAKRSGGFGLY